MQLDILFMAPHPDDLEIGMGGAIAKLTAQGYKVGMLHMTIAEPTPLGSPEVRLKEARAAADVLGAATMDILDLPNRELMDGPTARYAVASVIRKYRPPILVGMAGRTPAASPDHYQSQLIAEASRFYSQLTKWDDRFDGTPPHRVDHLVYRPVPIASETHHYSATFVMDITDTIDQKLAAVQCYASQFPGDRFARVAHFIRSTAGAEGGVAGVMYGERYALPRPVMTKDMVAMLGQWEVPPPFAAEKT